MIIDIPIRCNLKKNMNSCHLVYESLKITINSFETIRNLNKS